MINHLVGAVDLYRQALQKTRQSLQRGWITAKWETLPPVKRECRYYRLTALGKKQLAREESRWNTLAKAIASVLSSEKPA
jgi:DNA-binding PadR family transcriptional regulator